MTDKIRIIDDVFEKDYESSEKKLLETKQEINNMAEKQKRNRSIPFGIIGSGQAGSRLAEEFYSKGYSTIIFNTAKQDLEFIKVPEENKCLLEYGLGGAAKEIEIGKGAAETHKELISEMIQTHLDDCDFCILCLSLGGGSGAGSAETMIDVLSSIGKQIIVITVLPMANEDAKAKNNSIETLSKLTKRIESRQIQNLIVVDNAKIESLFANVGQIDFYSTANKAIIEVMDSFNYYSYQPSQVKPLDTMEFVKILIGGEGLSTYGKIVVSDWEDEEAIKNAIMSTSKSGILASGFDFKQAKYVGVLIVANKKVWENIPAMSVNYAMSMVDELCDSPDGIFKGIYTSQNQENVVEVYSFFSGLALPDERIQQLKKDTLEFEEKSKEKEKQRAVNLKLDTGTEQTISEAQKMKQKLSNSKSSFGRFITQSVQSQKKK